MNKTLLKLRLVFFISLLAFLMYVLIFKFSTLGIAHFAMIALFSIVALAQISITLNFLRSCKLYRIEKKIKE